MLPDFYIRLSLITPDLFGPKFFENLGHFRCDFKNENLYLGWIPRILEIA